MRTLVLVGTALLTAAQVLPVRAANESEVVIVTAEKQPQDLQSVPVAITTLSAKQLETRRVFDARDLGDIAPNLSTGSSTTGAGDLTISMRGLSAADSVQSLDSPVGLYIDGVNQARIGGAVLDLVELERVEVLRGPQGTLYGRNTTGGAINFITKKPAADLGLTEKFGYETYNGFTSRTDLETGNIANSGVSASLGFLYKKIGGYYDNVLQPSDKDPGADNTRAARVAIDFDQGGALKADYSLIYYASEDGKPETTLVAIRPDVKAALVPTVFPLVIGGGRPDKLALAHQSTSNTEAYLHNFTAEWAVSNAVTVRSITGYRHWHDLELGPDLQGNAGLLGFQAAINGLGPVDLYAGRNERRQEQFSEEMQLVGASGDRVKYVLGVYYFTEDGSELAPQTYYFPAFASQLAKPYGFKSASNSWALYGQGTYIPPVLDEKLGITLGLRYTVDQKDIELLDTSADLPLLGFQHLVSIGFTPGEGSRSFENLSYLTRVQYQFTDDIMGYTSYSTGYKAGGFNPRDVVIKGMVPSFGPEHIDALEIGLKSELFAKRLTANVAYFYNRVRNLQVENFVAGTNGAASFTQNAARVHMQGAEAELTAVPLRGVTINGALGYTKPVYDQFLSLDPITNAVVDVRNTALFAYTPEFTGNIGLQYDSDPLIGETNVEARIDVIMQSSENWLLDPAYPSGAVTNPFVYAIKGRARALVNGRVVIKGISINNGAGVLEISLWAKNILDKAYIVQGIDLGALGFADATYGPPRSGGVEVNMSF